MSWQFELKEYIVKVLEMGFSEDEIRAVLRSVGWKDSDIESGMLDAKMFLAKKQSLAIDLAPPHHPKDEKTIQEWSVRFAGSSKRSDSIFSRSERSERSGFMAAGESLVQKSIGANKSTVLIGAEKDHLLLEPATSRSNTLMPLESSVSLPNTPKVALSLFLALLKKRIKFLESREQKRAVNKKFLAALIQPKSRLFYIVAAPLPRPLLLEAPSWQTIFKLHSQFIAERAFRKIEAASVVLIRLALLPVVLLHSFASVFKKIVYASAVRSRSIFIKNSTDDKNSEERSVPVVKGDFSTPEVALAIGKFPEHIILFDIFKLAGRMFRTRRLRTFLTISGISVGIGTILFLVSFGYGLQNVLFERITTEEALLTLDVVPPADNAVVAIDDAMIGKIKEIDGVVGVSSMIALNGEMMFGDASAAGFVYAVDPAYVKLAGVRLAVGALTDENSGNAVIISSAAAKLLGWSDHPESALGNKMKFAIAIPKGEDGGEVETVTLSDDYNISGVVDDAFSVFAYFPIGQIKGKKLPTYSQLKVKVDDTNKLDAARDKILSHGLLVSMLSETVDQAKKVFNAVKIVLGLFGVITLVVSAIGMLNTMTIALLERTQEVGIMKAVGASNFDVWKLFLAEAVIMGFMGGVGGIVIGFTSAALFNYGINMLARAFGGQALNLFQAPIWFVFTIIIFSSCIGIITGLWPARRAARLDPLDAIRYK